MSALGKDRMTPERPGGLVTLGVKADTKIYLGALVVNDAGDAAPGTAATGLVSIGVAQGTVDNSGGSAGDKSVDIKRGVFRLNNSGSDAVTAAEIGKDCYIEDDHTVAKTDGTGTLSRAGKVFDLDSSGVWVDTRN